MNNFLHRRIVSNDFHRNPVVSAIPLLISFTLPATILCVETFETNSITVEKTGDGDDGGATPNGIMQKYCR